MADLRHNNTGRRSEKKAPIPFTSPPKANTPTPAVPPVVYIFDDKEAQRKSVKMDYDVEDQPLGMGAFGVVKKATEKMTVKPVAIKCIKKSDCKPEELIQEVRMLRLVKGYNGIVTLEEVYEGKKKVNLVMEYISGGELFDAIVENAFYSENDAAELIRQIVTTVEFVHSKHIVHRDFKVTLA